MGFYGFGFKSKKETLCSEIFQEHENTRVVHCSVDEFQIKNVKPKKRQFFFFWESKGVKKDYLAGGKAWTF